MIVLCNKDSLNAIAIYLRNRGVKAKKLSYEEYLLNIIGSMSKQVLTLGVSHSSDIEDLKSKLKEFINVECPWVAEAYVAAEEGDTVLLISGFDKVPYDVNVCGLENKTASDTIVEALNGRTC